VAVMNTRSLEMAGIEVDFPEVGGPARVAVSSTSELFVSGGPWLATVDVGLETTTGERAMPQAITGLGTGPGGLYVAMVDRVEVLDPDLGKRVATIPSPAVEDLDYVGVITP